MRMCFCKNAVFGTDKKTGVGYCRSHQTMRTDLDKRSIVQKAMSREATVARKIRGLANPEDAEMGSLQSLTNDLDKVFSLYIRIKYANKEGIVTCFVCDKPFHFSMLDNGHYVKRGHKALRFSEENCYPNCKKCNKQHDEDTLPFKEAIERYKPGLTDWLEEVGREVYKFGIDELKQMLITYRGKLEMVKKKLITR